MELERAIKLSKLPVDELLCELTNPRLNIVLYNLYCPFTDTAYYRKKAPCKSFANIGSIASFPDDKLMGECIGYRLELDVVFGVEWTDLSKVSEDGEVRYRGGADFENILTIDTSDTNLIKGIYKGLVSKLGINKVSEYYNKLFWYDDKSGLYIDDNKDAIEISSKEEWVQLYNSNISKIKNYKSYCYDLYKSRYPDKYDFYTTDRFRNSVARSVEKEMIYQECLSYLKNNFDKIISPLEKPSYFSSMGDGWYEYTMDYDEGIRSIGKYKEAIESFNSNPEYKDRGYVAYMGGGVDDYSLHVEVRRKRINYKRFSNTNYFD